MCGSLKETYIDVSLLVAQEEVVHDGAIVEVLEGRHVLHPSDAAVVHGLHLLPGECILLVGVDLKEKYGDVKKQKLKCGSGRSDAERPALPASTFKSERDLFP